jgi:hypothetical protein
MGLVSTCGRRMLPRGGPSGVLRLDSSPFERCSLSQRFTARTRCGLVAAPTKEWRVSETQYGLFSNAFCGAHILGA